ncbi:response regulator [Nakamurella sp. GG22]
MSAPTPAAGQSPILLVDDDMVSRLVLAHMLRRWGFAVVEADDLAPAVAELGTSRFSLVISDYSMPGGTGLELLEHLRTAAVQESRPPFVLVTGIVDDPASGGRFDEVDAYLTKPISTRALRACLHDVLPHWTPAA